MDGLTYVGSNLLQAGFRNGLHRWSVARIGDDGTKTGLTGAAIVSDRVCRCFCSGS